MDTGLVEQAGAAKRDSHSELVPGGSPPELPCNERANGTLPHTDLPPLIHVARPQINVQVDPPGAHPAELPLPLPLTAVLDSLHDDQLMQQMTNTANQFTGSSPLQLQANEELLSGDELEDMDTHHHLPTTVPVGSRHPHHSRSASPYPPGEDDDSFASFVAREVHDSASALDDQSSTSRSPTPLASSSQPDSDVHSLMSFIQGNSGGTALISQFGVTASCPYSPVQVPEGAVPAPLDMTSHNFPKRSKYAHRAAISAMHPYNKTRGGGASVAKTLDLLKAVLQSSFNMEVKRLCDDYLQIFNSAALNIRENTQDTVPDATLRLLVCKMLEEAQQGYQHGKWEFPSGKLPKNEKVSTAKGSPMSTKKVKSERGETRYGTSKRTRKAPSDRHGDRNFGWRWGLDKRRVDPAKWEPDKLSLTTNFVLGVNVNKALGHAANRGKVYYLHPELFKYACDGDDKTWLYENKHLPVHGGKAFLMIYSEVEDLVKSDSYYKDNPEIIAAVSKLRSFHVTQFMTDKMKSFMRSVQGYFAQEAGGSSASVGSSEGSK